MNKSLTYGMVGPMSNYAAPPQLVENVPYRVKPKRGKSTGRFGVGETLVDVGAVHAYAREFWEKNRSKYVEVQSLSGFCVLLKREVLQKIGPRLDQWTDLSLFDTEILSAKVREAGYTLAVCRDLFVHHFGTRTFVHGTPTTASR